MDNSRIDQAEGLRRIFRVAPPKVLAVIPCSGVTTSWLAAQLQERNQRGTKILVLDENEAFGNLADCLAVSPRFDLLHAVEGKVSIAQCLTEAQPGLYLAQAGGLARAMGGDRIASQRSLELLRTLRTGFDEWVFLSRTGDLGGLSPFSAAAPVVTLALDLHPQSVTLAWAALSRLARASEQTLLTVCYGGVPDERSTASLARFCCMAQTKLGCEVAQISHLDTAFDFERQMFVSSADTFIQRLLKRCSLPAKYARKSRFPGIAEAPRLGVP